jgi:phosphatidylinositol alpha-1,6-mannosyltransferase
VKHLLVTNDFPPKVGGIQTYLWELWRRLPPDAFEVLTTAYAGAAAWDAEQPFTIRRTREKVLWPTAPLARDIRAMADAAGAELVVFDPALPVGMLGPRLGVPYGVIVHGAEVTVPGRLPAVGGMLRRVLRGAELVIAAGAYPAAEAERAGGQALPSVVVPPGVDTARFHPLTAAERAEVRRRYDVAEDAFVVLCLSRLVPRKGFDVVLAAAGRLRERFPDLLVVVAGDGRDRGRLERRARTSGAVAKFLGRVPDEDLAAVHGCADLFAMVCRNRWHGLEQEGYGIVFVEAAACGVPQLAGASGGSAEAVLDGQTGVVVERPDDVDAVEGALATLLDDRDLLERLGARARERAVAELDLGVVARRLAGALGV